MEQYLSEQEQMLDKLSSDSEEFFNERLENIELLMQEAQEMANTNASEIKTTLEAETNAVGITLSDNMKTIWSPTGEFANVVSGAGNTVSTALTTTNSVLGTIKDYVAKICGTDEESKKQQEQAQPETPKQPEQPEQPKEPETPTEPEKPKEPEKSKTTEWGSWFVKKKYSGSNSKLNKNTSIVDRLRYFDFDSSFSARKKYYKAMKGSGTYKGTASQNNWMIKQMKKN
jgi:cell division septation protein DedD